MLIDTSRYPLVVLRLPKEFTAETVGRMKEEFEAVFARGPKYAVVADLRALTSAPDALVRKRLADTLNDPRFHASQSRHQLGSANVIASAPIRAAVTALLWVWRPPSPMVAVATIDEGIAWATDRLREAGLDVPRARASS